MTDRNIVDLAREVLDDELEWGALDPGHHPEGRAAVYRMANHAPALARAVVELTAELDAYREENTRHREKIARVETLADQYDAEARLEMREGDVSESINTQATSDRIRAALNGETDD